MAAHDTPIDMKALSKHLKVGSGNLWGGDAQSMETLLGIKSGSVNIFGLFNDDKKSVNAILDHRLANDF